MVSVGAAGRVQRDDIGLREQLVELADIARLVRGVARMVEHPHAEAFGAASDGASDTAESDESEGRAVYVVSEVLGDTPARPSTCSQIGFRGRRQPACGKGQ